VIYLLLEVKVMRVTAIFFITSLVFAIPVFAFPLYIVLSVAALAVGVYFHYLSAKPQVDKDGLLEKRIAQLEKQMTFVVKVGRNQ
jgi:membrane protein implicated in regulation of membrane protease activity